MSKFETEAAVLTFTPGYQSLPSYHNLNTLHAVISYLLIYAFLGID